jgi:hypothetical protein
MMEKDYVEQWVCLLREGMFGGEKRLGYDIPRVEITRQSLQELATNARLPMPVLSLSGQTNPNDGTSERNSVVGDLVALEVRKDERGTYLVGLVRTKSIAVAFAQGRRDRVTGVPLGNILCEAYLTDEKLQPFEPVSPRYEPST